MERICRKGRNDNIVKRLPNCQLLQLQEEEEAETVAASADLRAASAVQLVASPVGEEGEVGQCRELYALGFALSHK